MYALATYDGPNLIDRRDDVSDIEIGDIIKGMPHHGYIPQPNPWSDTLVWRNENLGLSVYAVRIAP